MFKVSTSGTERVLYSFKGPPTDGSAPLARLFYVNGELYGTTQYGGPDGFGTGCFGQGCGIVFKLTPPIIGTGSWTESVLYSFKGPPSDGAYPQAGLIDVNGTLYGTTWQGGASNVGTVFQVSTSGTESVLHSFGSGTDGASPRAGLIAVNGTLYGTTVYGGASFPNGAIFKVSTSGTESVIYSFKGGTDGWDPYGGLIADVNGALYGTTNQGGRGHYCYAGCGTVFKLTPPIIGSASWTKSVLHSFGSSGTDGASPREEEDLIDVNGELYGTTSGSVANGFGTVFKVSP